MGADISPAILSAGVKLPVLGADGNSSSNTTDPSAFICSTRGMDSGNHRLECSSRAKHPSSPVDIWECTSRATMGGMNAAYCSAANINNPSYDTFCSTLGGLSTQIACSTNADAQGTGHANCSAYQDGGSAGSPAGRTTCSAQGTSNGTNSCSSYGGSGANEHCSAGPGSGAQSRCSVDSGSGNTCTAHGSSTNQSCSTTSGAGGQCSSFDAAGNLVQNGDSQRTCN